MLEPKNHTNNLKEEKHPIATFISILLHPLFINIYGVALLFLYTNLGFLYQGQMSRFIVPVCIFSCFIPLVGIFLLKQGGYISSLSIDNKQERTLPFFVAFFGYVCQYFYFSQANVPFWFMGILLIPILTLITCYIINRYWKISIHMASVGALLGGAFSVSYNISHRNPFLLFMILFILAGSLGVARISARKHTPYQVYIGFMLGFCISYLTILFTVLFYIIFNSK